MRQTCETPLPEGQLVLGRKVGECVTIEADGVVGEVTVVEVRWQPGGEPLVRLAFRFPRTVRIMRSNARKVVKSEGQD